MTRDSSDRRNRMVALLEEAFESGALVFSDPLFDALEANAAKEIPGHVRTEQGIEYDIERRLGRGGMATVYLARDPKHDRPIAIKVLHADLTKRAGAERFVREIRLTARLQHPHVLALLDSGVFEGSVREADALAGRSFYTMPYVEGESLRVRLARDGALPLADATRVLREVADALSYAHERGVIHRDIKPENILLSGGHAVVADFGIAKALAAAQHDERAGGANPQDSFEVASTKEPSSSPSIALTQSSTLLGTPGYMAPEQAAAEAHIDHRADLYAWGVVAYETLSGQRPFASTQNAEPMSGRARMAEVPRSIRDVVPEVPVALGALVMRCLSKAPTDRPSSAAEVVAALDSVAIDTRAERTPRAAITRRVQRGVMAGLALLTVLVALVLYAKFETRTTAGGRATVVGTGNPAIDVEAVQAAINRADTVVLEGIFSFRAPPTRSVDPMLASAARAPAPRRAQVLVSKAVTISGVTDERGQMTTIDGGTIPFYVDAPGRVAIRSLRFVRPMFAAIQVHAVRDLEVAGNRIEGLQPFRAANAAIAINTGGDIPVPNDSGRPDLVSGSLLIRQNEIDVAGGTGREAMLGILVWSVGVSPRAEVALDITGNNIHNTTSSAIMVRRANGLVRILSNRVETREGNYTDYEAVRLANAGRFRMADNTIDCRWANCVGIAVFGQFEEWPVLGAIVENNVVNMLPPAGTVFADYGAAIKVKGFADANVVRYNTIRGRGRAALALETFKSGYPGDNVFIDNRVDSFQASVKSVVVGPGVLRTRLVHPGTVDDHGEGTKIEP